jgi:hypothetical protein
VDFCFAHFVFRINEKLHIAQLAKANENKKGEKPGFTMKTMLSASFAAKYYYI